MSRSFPKSCSVAFLLAEKDSGDFGSKASAIYDKVKEEMEKKKKEEEEKKRRAMAASAGGRHRSWGQRRSLGKI